MVFGYTEGGAWSDDGIKAISKFFDRIERAIDTGSCEILKKTNNSTAIGAEEKELNYWRHFAIKGVTEDEKSFNLILQLQGSWNSQMLYLNTLMKKTKTVSF